jgi:hypothetical protein
MDRIGYTRKKEKGEREVMKRIRLLVLLGVVAVALPLGVAFAGGAGAAGSSGSSGTSLSIGETADFNIFGTSLDVRLSVRCTGGSGTANITATQTRPETGAAAMGIGFTTVVCDGKTRSVGVTATGGVFDPGKAYVVADVTAPSGPAHAERWITVFVH